MPVRMVFLVMGGCGPVRLMMVYYYYSVRLAEKWGLAPWRTLMQYRE